MKKYIIVVLVVLGGCFGGSIESERLNKAVDFCSEYGGIYKLEIDSVFDNHDRVECFNQRKFSNIDKIKDK